MSRGGKLALFIVTLVFFVSLASPFLGLTDPKEINLDAIRQAPSLSHPFGTDNKGRDLFSRVIAGAKVSIGVALSASVVASSLGFAVGLMAGYLGGRLDKLLMALVDFVLSFPSLLFAIAVSIVLPSGLFSVMIAIAAVGWTSFARLVRGVTISVKEMPYVEAARALGCSDIRIVMRHIAPQCITGILVMMGIKFGGFILTEATLSFLGLGLQPPEPSWGAMVSAGRNHILTAPWMAIFPGAAIFITVLCLNIIGESLRKAYQITE